MSRSKAKGTAWESALVRYLREQGWEADRMTLSGGMDEGDICVREHAEFFSVIEAKATKALTAAAFVKEALIERDNFCRRRNIPRGNVMPVVVWKSPGQSVGDALCIIPLKEMFGNWETQI
jgi:Holliday junction resolvase